MNFELDVPRGVFDMTGRDGEMARVQGDLA